MDEKLATKKRTLQAQLDRRVRRTLQFYPAQHVFIDILPAYTTKSARKANTPLTKLLQKSFHPLKPISATSDTVTVDDNGVHNIVSIDRLTLAHYNTRNNDETYQDSDTQNADCRIIEDRTA